MDGSENAALFVNITFGKEGSINTGQFITEDEIAEHILVLLFVCVLFCNIYLLLRVQVSLNSF